MQPHASATFAMSASQASTDEPDHPLFSNSFQTIGKLLRVKSGSARSNLKRPSESMPSPTDTSRPGFFHFLSAPPSPRHLVNSFKSSRRKNMAPTDAFAQSSVPNTTFRSRTLSHSVSTPNFCASSPVPPPQSLSESSTFSTIMFFADVHMSTSIRFSQHKSSKISTKRYLSGGEPQ